MKKTLSTSLIAGIFVFLFSGMASAEGGNATTEEVYNLVIQAHAVVKELGEESFSAFNDPKGEFVLKDTYVVVIQCPSLTVTHPFVESARGMDMAKFPWFPTMCEAAKDPNGKWMEMTWPKPGETTPSRKLSFILAVEGTPYQLSAGIYSDEETVDELNASRR